MGQVQTNLSSERFSRATWDVLTANAYAFPAGTVRTLSGTQTRYITLVREGMLNVFDDRGYADVAPGALVADESYHHLQHLDGLTSALEAVVAENAADAGSTYVSSHVRGLAFQQERAARVSALFSTIGQDPAVNRTHGTQEERLESAQFGFRMQRDMRPRSFRFHPYDLGRIFVFSQKKWK